MNEAEDLRRLLPPLDDAPGPARRMDDAEAAMLITGVLDAWAPAPPPAGPEPVTGLASTKLVALGLGSVGLVALGVGVALLWPREPSSHVAATEPASIVVGPIDVDAVPDEVSDVTPSNEAPSDALVFVDPSDLGVHDEALIDDDVSASPRGVRRARRPRATPPVAPTMEPDSADDLLRRANALRSQRRWGEAERAYVEVTSAHSATHAAYVARVAAAALRLEHLGDAAGAARLYRAAIAHGGALDAEARHGLARAYARLGRRAEEADALRGLVSRHPSSPFAGAARARLTALEVE